MVKVRSNHQAKHVDETISHPHFAAAPCRRCIKDAQGIGGGERGSWAVHIGDDTTTYSRYLYLFTRQTDLPSTTHLAQRQQSYFQNSFALKEMLDDMEVPPNTKIFSCDAKSTYTNIPTEPALEV